MAVNDWIEDSDDDVSTWNQKAEEAKKRAATPSGIMNKFDRKLLGDKMKPSIFRALTVKFGEKFIHWLWLPNGKKVGVNCAIKPAQFDNRAEICPICAHTVAGGGHGPEGEHPDYNHYYYFICLMGQVEKVYMQNPKNPKDPEDLIANDKVVWHFEPMVLETTEGLYGKIAKHAGDPVYPEGANGKITAYNMKVWKYMKKGATGLASDVRYNAEYYDSAERVKTALNDKNEKVEIDLNIAMLLKDQVRAECHPSKPEVLRLMLDTSAAAAGSAAIGTTEEEPPAHATDGAASTAVADDFDDETPATEQAPPPTEESPPATVNKAPAAVADDDEF